MNDPKDIIQSPKVKYTVNANEIKEFIKGKKREERGLSDSIDLRPTPKRAKLEKESTDSSGMLLNACSLTL